MAGLAKMAAGGAAGAYAYSQVQESAPGNVIKSIFKSLPSIDTGASPSGRGGEVRQWCSLLGCHVVMKCSWDGVDAPTRVAPTTTDAFAGIGIRVTDKSTSSTKHMQH